MKTYVTFKCIGKIRDVADCYMTGLWTDIIKQKKAIEFFELYVKNWKSGLIKDEWNRAKDLISFWKNESLK